MFDIEKEKRQEIDRMISIVKQIDLLDILILTRDANTLLMRKQEADLHNSRKAG